jgi:hypothetical protein
VRPDEPDEPVAAASDAGREPDAPPDVRPDEPDAAASDAGREPDAPDTSASDAGREPDAPDAEEPVPEDRSTTMDGVVGSGCFAVEAAADLVAPEAVDELSLETAPDFVAPETDELSFAPDFVAPEADELSLETAPDLVPDAPDFFFGGAGSSSGSGGSQLARGYFFFGGSSSSGGLTARPRRDCAHAPLLRRARRRRGR